MKDPKPAETSKSWPWIKAIARHLTIPGTKIGMEAITELQDDLADEQFQDQVKAMLEVVYLRTAEITNRLRQEEHVDVEDENLRTASAQLAEALYLKQVADKYFYADFKGIAQENKFVSLPLDDVFVDLKAVTEDRDAGRQEKEQELRARLDESREEEERTKILEALEELDVRRGGKKPDQGGVSIGQLLKSGGTTVLLGGPGSGKTTLVKRLARCCALGAESLGKRYPEMAWGLPLVVPATQFATERDGRTLLDYVEGVLRQRGGEPLLARYREHFANHRVILLLDGLDEVADASQRVASARAVDEAAGALGNNRLLVTSRQVGYAICRLSAPSAHYLLLPFSPRDITTFVIQWHLAYEKANKEDKADLSAARQAGKSLNEEIEQNASVASLATNPLMLTIIALIKHQNVVLPERRVELYEVALKTLIHSWNLARSLAQTQSQRPLGESQPRIEQTRAVWSVVAYWMHETANREVNRTQLHNKIVEVLMAEFDKAEFEAHEIAESYLNTAAETSGLLEPRGPNTFAFVHQSFQEYLAALYIARPPSKAAAKLREHCHDPRWHEVIRLAAGHLGVTLGEREVLADIVGELLNSPDPLEPFLCTSLRLALGCLADQVGIRQQQSDAILIATVERLRRVGYRPAHSALADALRPIELAPGENAQIRLLELATEEDWRIRMEAVRLVSLSKRLGAATLQQMHTVFNEDRDPDVRAHAAWALWKQGAREDKVTATIAHGLSSRYAHMRRPPDDLYPPVLVKLLEASDPDVRYQAAEVLGNWGQQPTALPVLVKLLEDPDANVRYQAAEVLGNWGQQATAVPVLVKLLEDPEANVRFRAALALGNWGPQATALPVLVKLLEDPEANLRYRAAVALGDWGQQKPEIVGILVKELVGEVKPALSAFFQPRSDHAHRIADKGLRAELVKLFTPVTGETPRRIALREFLFGLFWQSCATTA